MSGWRAKTGASLPPSPLSRVDRRSFPAGLLAERFGEPFFELAGAGGEPQGAFVGGEEIGLQGRAGDARAGGSCSGGRGGYEGVDFLQQVAVPVEEGAVDGGGAGDAGDADLGPGRGCLADGG